MERYLITIEATRIYISPQLSLPLENLFRNLITSADGEKILMESQPQKCKIRPGQMLVKVLFLLQLAKITFLQLTVNFFHYSDKYECFGYGSNNYGQLSLEGDHIHRPTQLSCFKEMKIAKIVSGSYHSFVQNSKGEVYGFGLNMKGQLGIGTF